MKYLHSVPFLSKILKNKLYLLLLIIFLLSAGYFIYKNYFTATQKTTYDLVRVERGDIITSISGSGQIISETQIDTKAESSGKITSIRVKAGDKVTRGEILATLDQRNALTSLRQARNSYASAKASYDKFISGISENDKKVANLSIEQAEENLNNAKQNLIDKGKLSEHTEQSLGQGFGVK
jgi:multidrug efflux pump subunit AcrA (membrane-fusion protein)